MFSLPSILGSLNSFFMSHKTFCIHFLLKNTLVVNLHQFISQYMPRLVIRTLKILRTSPIWILEFSEILELHF